MGLWPLAQGQEPKWLILKLKDPPCHILDWWIILTKSLVQHVLGRDNLGSALGNVANEQSSASIASFKTPVTKVRPSCQE